MVKKHQVHLSQFGEGWLAQVWEGGQVGEERESPGDEMGDPG